VFEFVVLSFNVLICDDSALARKMSKRCLPQNFASHVQFAENGQQAINKLSEQRFDLLLLDLTMPIMDGIQVLTELRMRNIDTMTIVISGDVQPEMQKRALSLGAMAFITKPIDAPRLENTLKQYGMF
jgi:CheY-like chemotaxis protein